jgi:hypothetical protein
MDQVLLDERLLAQEYRDQGTDSESRSFMLSGTVSANPGSINGATRGSVDVTIDGVAVGDLILMNPPDGLNAGLAYAGCRVTAANTVRIYLANLTLLPINDGSNDWNYLWLDLT